MKKKAMKEVFSCIFAVMTPVVGIFVWLLVLACIIDILGDTPGAWIIGNVIAVWPAVFLANAFADITSEWLLR